MPLRIFDRIFHRKFSDKQGELYSYIYHLTGIRPRNLHLYEQALTHRSLGTESNERLEYLGDALIGMVVAEELFKLYPTEGEGFLTRTRSKVVCRENLNHLAHELGIDNYLHTGIPLKKNTENVYGNALEALAGAALLDAGYQEAAEFIRRVVVGRDGENLQRLAQKESDFKSRLLEYARSKHLQVEFVLVAENYHAKDDRHVFVYEVRLEGNTIAQAEGYSKVQAQQTAAHKALQKLQ